MLHGQHGQGEVLGKLRQHGREGSRPPRRDADGHHLPALSDAGPDGRHRPRTDARSRRRRRRPRRGPRLVMKMEELKDLGHQFGSQAGHGAVQRPRIRRLGHVVVGPQGQRVHRRGRTPLGQRTEHDHIQIRVFLPDAAERLQSVHGGHLDVQRDHVRIDLGDLRQRDGPIRSRAHHLDSRLLAQRVRHEPADDHRVVHDEDPDATTGLQDSLSDRHGFSRSLRNSETGA